MNNRRPLFITLEGGEGSGKTTMMGRLAAFMQNHSIPYLITREPGGIEIAEKIRSIILDPEHTAMDARTEALLYAAARRQHLVEKVEPALRQGLTVLCDRFVDSSLVYQDMHADWGWKRCGASISSPSIPGCPILRCCLISSRRSACHGSQRMPKGMESAGYGEPDISRES